MAATLSPTGSTDTLSEGIGIIDHDAFAKRWPAVAYHTAVETAKDAGVDPSDAKTVAKVMQSRTYKERAAEVARSKDSRFLKRIMNRTPVLPDRNAPLDQQVDQTYGGLEQNKLLQIRAGEVTGRQMIDANSKLDALADFDREAYKSKRIKEMNPTADLDSRMLSLRMQAFTAKAMVRNELRGLPPALRDRAVAARLQIFADTLESVKEIRDARLKSAEGQIDDEIDAHNEEFRAAKSRVSALDSLIKTIEKTGENSDALASIRLDWLKEKKKLIKTGGSSTGTVDEEETVANAILNDYVKHYGASPSSDQIREAKRQAKEAVARRKQVRDGIKGTGSAVAGLRSVNLMQLPQPQGLIQSEEQAKNSGG